MLLLISRNVGTNMYYKWKLRNENEINYNCQKSSTVKIFKIQRLFDATVFGISLYIYYVNLENKYNIAAYIMQCILGVHIIYLNLITTISKIISICS